MTNTGMTSTAYEKLDCVNNEIKINITSGQYVALPTDDNTKLPQFNEYVLNGSHTAFEDVTLLSSSYDDAEGLFWMSRPYIVILDDTFNFIYVYLFPERPKSIEIDAEGGDIIELTVHTQNCICWRSRIPHCAPIRDTDSDGCPDCLDLDYPTSIKSLFRASAFNYNWQIKYALSKSITTNDFSIALGDLDIVPFAVSGGNRVTDASGNVLTAAETVTVGGGTVDLYDVSELSEIRVEDVPGNNAGDVQVFDTVTPGASTGWTQVASAGHEFTGDKVIQNGLIRLINGKLYVYIESGYVYIGYLYGSNTQYFTISSFSAMSPDSTSFVISSGTGGVANAIIARGSSYISISFTDITSTSFFMLRDDEDKKFRFYSYGSTLLDTAFLDGGFADVNYQYVYSVIPSALYIPYVATTESNNLEVFQGIFPDLGWEFGTKSPAVLFVGALPISPKYIEAEAMTLGGGATLSTLSTMYPGTGNTGVTLDAQGEYAEKTYTVGTDIGPYVYTLFIRAIDSDQVADDFEVSVYDVTAEADILAASTNTLTDAFSYVTEEFTITSAMDGHTIRIRMKKATATANTISADYCLAVQAAEIEKQTKRSLAVVNTTKSIIKLPR